MEKKGRFLTLSVKNDIKAAFLAIAASFVVVFLGCDRKDSSQGKSSQGNSLQEEQPQDTEEDTQTL